MAASRGRRGSVHELLETKLAGAVHVRDPPEVREAFREYDSTPPTDPDDVIVYVFGVVTAWCVLALVAGFLMVGIAYLADQIAGPSGRDVALAVGLALGFFCLSGAVNGLWRQAFAYEARRHYRRYGPADRRYQRAASSALPRNTSLITQAGIAALVAFVVVSSK